MESIPWLCRVEALTTCIELRQRVLSDEDAKVAEALDAMASCMEEVCDYDSALHFAQEAFSLRLLHDDKAQSIQSLHSLVRLQARLGLRDEVECSSRMISLLERQL